MIRAITERTTTSTALPSGRPLHFGGLTGVMSRRESTKTGRYNGRHLPARQHPEGPSLAAMSSGSLALASGAVSMGARWPGFAAMAALDPAGCVC